MAAYAMVEGLMSSVQVDFIEAFNKLSALGAEFNPVRASASYCTASNRVPVPRLYHCAFARTYLSAWGLLVGHTECLRRLITRAGDMQDAYLHPRIGYKYG